MAGYLLIVSILLLGGVIATVGDRLGYKVGKARLSLFNMRPRNTAVLITILTGGLISASTLGILFAVSDSLRTGVFELEEIQQKLADSKEALRESLLNKEKTQGDLEEALRNKKTIEAERNQAQRDRLVAQTQLDEINRSLKVAEEQELITAAKLQAEEERANRLRLEIERIEADQQKLIAQRDQVRRQIAERDREVQRQETIIAEGKTQVSDLEAQQQFLDTAIVELEADLRLLREKRVVLTRGEVLAAQLLQVNDVNTAEQVVDTLLRQANQTAHRKTRPGTGDGSEVVIQIPQAEVTRLIQRLSDGQPYVVRVLSAGNYITGEIQVLVFVDVSLNKIIFQPGEVIASTVADPTSITGTELRERINLLLSASQFRARQSGIVNDNIEFPIEHLVNFLDQLVQYDRPLVIQAVAIEPTYTAGPLRLEFLALDNDQIIFRSRPPASVPGI